MGGTVAYGTNLYGRVDNIPGFGYVATEFSHFYFIPLFPQRSWLILQGPGTSGLFAQRTEWNGFGMTSPLWKSVLAAWLRAFAWLYAVSTMLAAVVAHFGADPTDWGRILRAVVFVGLAIASTYASRASFGRAVMLLKMADVSDDQVRRVEQIYGRTITDSWAGRKLSGSFISVASSGAASGYVPAHLDLALAAGVAIVAEPDDAAASTTDTDDAQPRLGLSDLTAQALQFNTPPEVYGRRDLRRLGIAGIVLGLITTPAGTWLGLFLQAALGLRTRLLFLPAFLAASVYLVGWYRVALTFRADLAGTSPITKAIRMALALVALAVLAAAVFVTLWAVLDW